MALRLPSWQAEGCRRTVLKVSIHDVCCVTSPTTPGPQARLTFAAVGDRRSASGPARGFGRLGHGSNVECNVHHWHAHWQVLRGFFAHAARWPERSALPVAVGSAAAPEPQGPSQRQASGRFEGGLAQPRPTGGGCAPGF